MAAPITYGFGNIGRDQTTGRRDGGGISGKRELDQAAMRALKRSLPNERAIVFLCEINEGDTDNELAEVRQVFKGWGIYAGSRKHPVSEPILLSPDFGKAKWNVRWVKDSSVKGWSPQRSLLTVTLPGADPSLLGMHYPAGAYGQGDRPGWAKPLLNKAWDNCRKVHRSTQNRLVKAGRDVVWMMDTNDYTMKRLPGEKTIVHDATDWGRVEGGRPDFKALGKVDFKIDSHDGQRMRGAFKG